MLDALACFIVTRNKATFPVQISYIVRLDSIKRYQKVTVQSSIPSKEVKSSRIRRTRLTIARENKQILDYIVKGASHEQIMEWVGLNEKNYWYRIQMIRKRDMELTKAEQTPEAHAFLYKRTEEKFHNLEVMTMQIVESKNEQARDRIEAIRFIRQLYEDQYSLFMYGPSLFLTRDTKCGMANILDQVKTKAAAADNDGEEDDSNRVF
jgi:hypothetical protein